MRGLVWPVNDTQMADLGRPESRGSAAQELARALGFLSDLGELPHQLVLVAVRSSKSEAPAAKHDLSALGSHLKDTWRIEAKPRVMTPELSSDSLDDASRSVSKWTSRLASDYERVYLLLNPALSNVSSALLLAFLAAKPEALLALEPLEEVVRPVGAVRHVRVAYRRRDLETTLAQGRFGAALELLPADCEGLGITPQAYRALCLLLQSAEERSRFELESARKTLAHALAEESLSPTVRTSVLSLYRSVPTPDDRLGLLRELYHNAHQKLRYGEYADFILRLFNYQQEALRLALQESGVRFASGGALLDKSWVDGEEGLVSFTQSWSRENGISLDFADLHASGPALVCLAAYLSSRGRLLRDIVLSASRLQKLGPLRNRCFAAHDFSQVGWNDIAEAFGGSKRAVLDSMWTLYAAISGHDVGSDVFDVTAAACRAILADDRI